MDSREQQQQQQQQQFNGGDASNHQNQNNNNNNNNSQQQQQQANSSILVSSLREFQNELDHRNAVALNELNRQIDQLARVAPVDDDSLIYGDGIEYTSPPIGYATISSSPHFGRGGGGGGGGEKGINDNPLPKSGPYNFNQYLDHGNGSNGAYYNGAGGEYTQQQFNNLNSGPPQHLDQGLEVQQNREKLDERIENILNLSKPMTAATGLADGAVTFNANGQAFPKDLPLETPNTPMMDFSKDPLTQRIIQETGKDAFDERTPLTSTLPISSVASAHVNNNNPSIAQTSQRQSSRSSVVDFTSEKQFLERKKVNESADMAFAASSKALQDSINERQSRGEKYTKNMAEFAARLDSIQKVPSMSGLLDFDDPPLVARMSRVEGSSPTGRGGSISGAGSVYGATINDQGKPQQQYTSQAPPRKSFIGGMSEGPQQLPVPLADDNRAIIEALRTLQDRVGRLEYEKATAKEKIGVLEMELSTTRNLLVHQQQVYQNAPLQFATAPSAPYIPIPLPALPVPTKSDVNAEFRATLPIPDRSQETTMKNITEARQKVENLQDQVNRVRHLAEDSAANHFLASTVSHPLPALQHAAHPISKHSGARSPTLIEKQFAPYPSSSVHKKTEIADPMTVFDEILQKHSKEILKDATSPKKKDTQAQQQKQSPVVNKHAWSEESTKDQGSSSSRGRGVSAPVVIDPRDQIMKLQKEIEAEREFRRPLPTDTQTIKGKVLEKMKATSASSVKPKKAAESKSSASTVPVWKRGDQVRTHVREPSHTSSSSAHLRKKSSTIEIPSVTASSTIQNADTASGREMPFMVGRNTGKSFSVTANLQRVFSLLKSHNPEICTVCSKKHPPNERHHHSHTQKEESRPVHVLDGQDPRRSSSPIKPSKDVLKKPPIISVPSNITKDHLKEAAGGNSESLVHVLGILEQEFQDCKTQYNQLVKQYELVAESMSTRSISEKTGSSTLKAIGDDLRHVIQSMEAKSDQIAILRDIITSTLTLNQKALKYKKKVAAAVAPKRYTMDTATSRSRTKEVSSKDPHWALHRARSQSPGRALASLSLLKSSFQVQNALGP